MAQWKVRCQCCGPRQKRQARVLLKVHHGLGVSRSMFVAAFEGACNGFEFFVHGRISVFVERPRHSPLIGRSARFGCARSVQW